MAKFIRSVFITIFVATVAVCVHGLTPLWHVHEKPSNEERDILRQIIGKSSEESINKLGLPGYHVVLDDQHYYSEITIAVNWKFVFNSCSLKLVGKSRKRICIILSFLTFKKAFLGFSLDKSPLCCIRSICKPGW